MGEVVAFDGGLPDKPNATVGQALFAAVVDELRAVGIPALPPRLVATAVKQGKESLYAGVAPELVLAGCITALRAGKSRYTADIIGDLCLAKAGEKMSDSQYRQLLEIENNRNNEAQTRVREALAAHNRPSIEKGESA